MNLWHEWRGPRSGWSRTTKVVAFVVGMLLVVGWAVAVDVLDGRAAVPSLQHGSEVAAQRGCVPPSGGDETCAHWARKQVRKFRHGRTGDSHGIQRTLMPKRKWDRLMRSAVHRYEQQHRARFAQPSTRARDGWCSICDYFFEAERCMATGLHPSGCAEAEEDAAEIRRVGKRISAFTITCGGGAVIGAGATRNPGGAIFGGLLACGWGRAADLPSAEPCQHHPRPAARESTC